jgi:hypothetical protein
LNTEARGVVEVVVVGGLELEMGIPVVDIEGVKMIAS